MKERNLIVRGTKMIRTKFDFKKIFLFLFILLITFTLSACGVDPQPNEETELEDITLTIYTLNDFLLLSFRPNRKIHGKTSERRQYFL